MRVGKVGHATVMVQEGDTLCLMDPVLVSPFESGANELDPPVHLDADACARAASLLVLSHAHMDHFCVRSLDLFARDVPVVYPRGAALIERALTELGFQERVPVAAGEKLSVSGLELFPTASRADFPEMGLVFRGGERTFWNAVDSVLDGDIIDAVHAVTGAPDLLFAKFQPLVETELLVNGLGSDFPFEKYAGLLRAVWDIRPRCVAPGSCGYRYARAPWLNDRGFPITERQFEADLRRVDPFLRVLQVPHGATVDLTRDFALDERGVPFATRASAGCRSTFAWRPDRGVPALMDENPKGLGEATLIATVAEFLEGAFLEALRSMPRTWLDRMRRNEVLWHLEVLYPDGSVEARAIDFGDPKVRWCPVDVDAFFGLHTSITASALAAVLAGELSSYGLMFNAVRIVERLYQVGREGISRAGSFADDPLTKVLFLDADERFIEAELRAVAASNGRRQRALPSNEIPLSQPDHRRAAAATPLS